MNSIVRVSSATLLLSTVLSCRAQSMTVHSLPDRGVLTTMQAGMVLDDDPGRVSLKRASRSGPVDVYPTTAQGGVLDASGQAIGAWIAANYGVELWVPAFDALTTRNDAVPLDFVDPASNVADDEYFRIRDAGAASWAMLEIGIPGGSINGTTQVLAGGDQVAYYFNNPGFPLQLRNGLYREIVDGELVAGSSPAPGNGVSIEAFDAALGLIESAGQVRQFGIVEVFDELYFSVTPESAGALNQLNVAPFGTVDGATIFRVRFNPPGSPTAGQIWDVDVFRTSAALGLTSDDDIDALGMADPPQILDVTDPTVHQLDPAFPYILLSLNNNNQQEQLMVVANVRPNGSNTSSQQRRPLHDEGGNPLLGPGGTLTGNVKSACGHDPEGSWQSYSAGFTFDDTITDDRMILSTYAVDQPASDPPLNDRFRLYGSVAGWGQMTPGPTAMFLWLENDGISNVPVFLGSRAAADDSFDFSLTMTFPWDTTGGATILNNYRAFVIGVPQGTMLPFYSTQVEFQRWPL